MSDTPQGIVTVDVIGPNVPAARATVFPDPQEFSADCNVDCDAPEASVVQTAAWARPQASNPMMTTPADTDQRADAFTRGSRTPT